MTDRPHDQLRPVSVELGFTSATPGSVLISMGRTRVLCTASVEEDVPRWMRDTGRGWVTAEYAMLPGSSSIRVSRDHITGGRAKEISRLIGRALRAAVNLKAMEGLMVRVDCDVIEADGGTRTAAVTGAWIAMHQALADAVEIIAHQERFARARQVMDLIRGVAFSRCGALQVRDEGRPLLRQVVVVLHMSLGAAQRSARGEIA